MLEIIIAAIGALVCLTYILSSVANEQDTSEITPQTTTNSDASNKVA